MLSKGKKHWPYYHNIADSLTITRDFELAEQYFQLCIEKVYLENGYTSEQRNHYVGTFKLTYIECLLKKKDLAKAKEVFSTINPKVNLIPEREFIFYALNIILSIDENPDYLTDIQQLKEKLFKDEHYLLYLLINELLISFTNPTTKQLENILLESVEVTNYIHNVELKRQARVEIIKFYIHNKNESSELRHLKELFKIDSEKEKEKDGELQNIFIQEMSVFIGNLKKQNTLVSTQKKELEEITYILSHDLKTPLRIISSFSELAQRKLAKKEFQVLDEYLGHIKKSSKNLHELVEDVNILHKIEQDDDHFVSVDLNLIANKVIELLGPFCNEKKATIEIKNQLPVIQGIPSNYFIVFQNLIENGLKYNESINPKVSICSVKNERTIQLFFEDNGMGIEKEYHEYIFHYFKRLHNNASYEGTGFGLGICKKIITNFNGSIRVESKLGEGSTFIVSLQNKQ